MENDSEVEKILLNIVDKLEEQGSELYRTLGTESYVQRCNLHDAKIAIYRLTNKHRVEQENQNQFYDQIKNRNHE